VCEALQDAEFRRTNAALMKRCGASLSAGAFGIVRDRQACDVRNSAER
jgi:hypothetical protein